jgi:hypothetical protein
MPVICRSQHGEAGTHPKTPKLSGLSAAAVSATIDTCARAASNITIIIYIKSFF